MYLLYLAPNDNIYLKALTTILKNSVDFNIS